MKFYSSNTSVGFIELVKLETENESKTTKEQACQIFLHICESLSHREPCRCVTFVSIVSVSCLSFFLVVNLSSIARKLIWIYFKVLEGLHYLHTKCKIIHTDIKPENVLICIETGNIRKIAADATHIHRTGRKLPKSAGRTIWLRLFQLSFIYLKCFLKISTKK